VASSRGGGAGRAPARAQPAASDEATLHRQISEEVRERQEFLGEMASMGRTEHDAPVRAQIQDRMRELKRLEQMMK
jgi:hypothetical protein